MTFLKKLQTEYLIIADDAGQDLSKDVATIKELVQGVNMNPYAKAYYNKLGHAATLGKKGLKAQVLYLLSNLEDENGRSIIKPKIRKQLKKYGNEGVFA